MPNAKSTNNTASQGPLRSWLSQLGPRESTRRMWREARKAGRPWWMFFETYAYIRWPNGYIGSAIGERPVRRLLLPLFAPFLQRALRPHRWADSYHGKVLPLDSARRLVQVREDVCAVVPEQVVPFEHARDLVLQHPDHIVVLDCPCRLSRKDPCLPLDVCLIVGEPFASFVLDHHPLKSRAISPEEAVEILQAESRRGHVHHAFFKEAMLDRFYAICNCCSCCCGAISAHRHGSPMLIASGYVSKVDPARCEGCGICQDTCAFDALALEGICQVDGDACMGCGACVQVCPHDALSLVRDETKPAPMEIPA